MTDMQLGTFHPFPLLPKELRLEIWKLALPDPRVIELSLLRSDYPLRLPQRYYRASRGAWWWVASASPTTFPLIRTNAEARSIALASYERCEILNRNDTVRHPMYINFSKDTIFVTRDAVDDLKEVLVGSHRRVRFMNWRTKVRNLALPLDILERPGYLRAALIPGPEPADPKGFKEATRYIADIVRTFPGLKDLSLVIDARNPGFGGDAEIIESTSEHEDYEEPEGRELASSWIPEVLAGLASESSDVQLPSVRLALLINGRDTPELERRWTTCERAVECATQTVRQNRFPMPVYHASSERILRLSPLRATMI